MALVDRRRSPEASGEIDQVDDEVVESEQQETNPREQREFGGHARENLRGIHDSDWTVGLARTQCRS